MKSYLLFVPRLAEHGDERALERAILIRDTFNWPAFIAPLLWGLYFRHWLLALGVASSYACIFALAQVAAIPSGAVLLLFLVVRCFVGLEASTMRGWLLNRRQFRVADIVVAHDQAEAETMLFRRWLVAGDASGDVAKPAGLSARSEHSARIVGLFPAPEGGH